MAVGLRMFLARILLSSHYLISEQAPNRNYIAAATGGATVARSMYETRRDVSRLERTVFARRARTSDAVIPY